MGGSYGTGPSPWFRRSRRRGGVSLTVRSPGTPEMAAAPAGPLVHQYAAGVINGGHVIIYSGEAESDRAFLRDVLDYPHVDAGAGWLIFKLPPSEIAVHPIDGPPVHEFYLMCDDLDATMAQLTAKGATFAAVTEARWGRLTKLRLPGGGELGMYEPRHPRATEL